MDAGRLGKAANAVNLMLGMDISYNIGSFSLSAPQTTQRRISDQEGSSETPKQAMEWVWLSTWKMLAYTLIPSIIGRTVWPFIGGLVVIADVHASYQWAIRRGMQSISPGGKLVSHAVNGTRPEGAAGPISSLRQA